MPHTSMSRRTSQCVMPHTWMSRHSPESIWTCVSEVYDSLHCDIVCCSALQCDTVCWSVLQCVATFVQVSTIYGADRNESRQIWMSVYVCMCVYMCAWVIVCHTCRWHSMSPKNREIALWLATNRWYVVQHVSQNQNESNNKQQWYNNKQRWNNISE